MKIRLEEFVRQYTDPLSKTFGNATKTAEAVGYSPKSAHVTGARLIRNHKVVALIAQKKKEVEEAQKNTKEGILKDLYQMRDETKDMRLKLQIIDRISAIEGFEAPKRTENKNENLNLDMNDVLDKAQDAMREVLRTQGNN